MSTKQHSQWPSLHTWERLKVSKTMRATLRNLLRQPQKTDAQKGTLNALKRRNLVNDAGQLTNEGYVYALSLCPLQEQIEFLDIPLSHIELPKSPERPEFDLMEIYKNKGWSGCFAEGGAVFVLLYAIWFDTLLPYVEEEYDNDIDYVEYTMYNVYSYNLYLDDIPDAHTKLLQAIQDISRKSVASNYDKIESLQYSDTWFPYGYYGISKSLILQLFDWLGRDRLVLIASILLEDRYLFSKGWPDLTLVRNGNVRFVEVKTTDKLHFSQLVVMPTMMQEADLNFEIVKIKYV